MKFGPAWAEIDWQQENLLGAFKEIQTKILYKMQELILKKAPNRIFSCQIFAGQEGPNLET